MLRNLSVLWAFRAKPAIQVFRETFFGAGYEANPPANLPQGACVITLVGGTYAVIRKRAPMHELPQLFDHLFQTWLPASDCQVAEGAVFERYPDDPEAPGDARLFEVWAPVQPR